MAGQVCGFLFPGIGTKVLDPTAGANWSSLRKVSLKRGTISKAEAMAQVLIQLREKAAEHGTLGKLSRFVKVNGGSMESSGNSTRPGLEQSANSCMNVTKHGNHRGAVSGNLSTPNARPVGGQRSFY